MSGSSSSSTTTSRPPGSDPKENISPEDPVRRGIFYPRATGLGGCTIHNAMITIAGPIPTGKTWPISSGTTRGAAATMRGVLPASRAQRVPPAPDARRRRVGAAAVATW